MRPALLTSREGRGGFTIVEVVLAMFVLLIGMTTILGLLSFGAALARTAELRSEAANAIEVVVADLEETFFPLVETEGRETVGEPRTITTRPVPGHDGLVYSASARPNPEQLDRDAGPLEYRVDVEISWSSAGAKRSRKFTILLLREVPFGERLRRRFVEGADPPPENPGPAAAEPPSTR